ncbi:DUF6777 domain-containing protein [Streptomyces sp. ATexAB-D23]|uniref:DUF6777 domain-containing protein n=1 Tax=unclassified Streptomyces TaxID=2593676 RepID=UPI00037D6E7F|nr:DUF6777 domain-containing protein [Streptomyces sp. ATexAB-D23]MYY04680.1 hypothetical protein [Streptomyces sp. SID4913]
MHSRIRLRRTAPALLSAGLLLAAGCAQETSRPASTTAEDVLLQAAADTGPSPFTGSSAAAPVAAPGTHPDSRSPAPPGGGKPLTRTGSTPGLYGGTRAVPSCDVETQIRMLAADPAREAAFARTVSVGPARVPAFLRALTPVLLRADTLVTGHGYRAGSVTAFRSVLQAGTAVMVDGRGLPRVRCACGNPLDPPGGAAAGAAAGKGERWAGFDPARTVVIEPAARPVTELVIVDVEHRTWIARPSGDGGAGDRAPAVPPPYGPGTDITGTLPELPPTGTKEPRPPKRSERPEEPAEPTPSRSRPPGDCPPSAGPTPPGEPAGAAGVPARSPGETNCPTPTGAPTEPQPDEPRSDEPEPDEPPRDPVPSMTGEPQTSIQLPRHERPVDGGAARRR